MDTYFVEETGGEVAHLGVADMRLLLSGDRTNGALAVGEFTGAPGPWTVPHLHREVDEFFYVVEGIFQFTCGDSEFEAKPGSLLMVPRGTTHVFTAETDGKVLLLWTPGGLEQMFLDLGRLAGADLTDKAQRAEIAKRYDSIPV